jgi:2-C-methyl-D-erythritol 4-phosphate cytidylyltransferase
MDVIAVVVARGVPGPGDPLAPVAGVPMVARAVRTLLTGLSTANRADRVIVVAPADRRGAVERACAGLPVEVRDARLGAHVGQRRTPVPGDGPSGDSWILLHDAARPLAPASLVASVLAAATAVPCDAVVPVLPLTDTVKLVDADGLVTATPDRTRLRVLQTPQLVRPHLLDGLLDGLLDSADDPLDAVPRLAGRGRVHQVEGDPLAFPVRTAWDRQLAELLVH